ncbi:TonB-dependent receptor [Paracidovorax wautersii]|uniref:TonB-dependent receptor n=1 Tax=Paracidovorax wautersii TaxID=1177982 RepID=UPI0031D17DA6
MPTRFAGKTSPPSSLLPLAAACLACLCSTALAQVKAAEPALSDVTVTSGKREQPLSQLIGAAVVRDRQALDDAQVSTTQDLQRVLPGVQISQSASFLFPIISVRGVSSAQDFYNPALTVYVDGVPQLPIFAIQSLQDVERVELLKGPQGTLYGKSAQGGVLNVVTQRPDSDTRVHLGTGISSRGGYRLEGSASGALMPGLLYGSAAVSRDNAPGALHNPATGADDQGGARSTLGTAKLRLAPSGAPWELALNVGRECTRASQDAYVPWDDIGSREAFVAAGMPIEWASFTQKRCGTSQSLSGQYDLGDWRLSAVTAWQDADIARRFPLGPYDSQQPERWRQNMQEIRLATRADAAGGKGPRSWDGVFGLYRQAVHQQRDYTNALPTYGLVGLNAASDNDSSSLAAYGDVTWHATRALDVSAGLRHSRDKASSDFAGSALNASFGTDSFSGSGHTAGHTTLGKLGASYQWTPALRSYATVSQGYKPGGFNLAPSSPDDAQAYGRERSTSYELGTRWQQGDLQLGAALYQINIQDTQLYRGNDLGYQSLRNVGDTRSRGLELDARWRLNALWTLQASAALNKATFRRYDDPSACGACAGNDVPFAPHQLLTLGASGRFATAWGTLRPTLSVRRTGAQYFDTANTLRQPGYTLVDASINWAIDSRWQVTAYVHNLTDKDYRVYGFSNAAIGTMAQVALPRTVGVMLAYDY